MHIYLLHPSIFKNLLFHIHYRDLYFDVTEQQCLQKARDSTEEQCIINSLLGVTHLIVGHVLAHTAIVNH